MPAHNLKVMFQKNVGGRLYSVFLSKSEKLTDKKKKNQIATQL